MYLLGPCPKTLRRKQLSLGKVGIKRGKDGPLFLNTCNPPTSWPILFGQSVWLLSYHIKMYSAIGMPQNRFILKILQGLAFQGQNCRTTLVRHRCTWQHVPTACPLWRSCCSPWVWWLSDQTGQQMWCRHALCVFRLYIYEYLYLHICKIHIFLYSTSLGP